MRDKFELEKVTAESTMKGLLGALPFIGTAVNELLFDGRGRLKQARINKFVQAFHAYLDDLKDADLHLDQIEKEDFGDFFETLLIRVSQNHSELKKEAFQRLLGNQLLRPVDVDYNLLYLDIISGLHEKQIPILEKFYDSQADCAFHTEWQAKLAQRQKDLVDMNTFNDRMNNQIYAEGMLDTGTGTGNLDRLIDERKAEVEAAKVEITKFRAPFLPVTYGIEPDEFPVLIQDLCNKGLLIDYSTKYAYDPHTLLEISVLGLHLMQSLSDPTWRKI